jgi:mannose-6-phosphate isomerase-like protein (cupin superfamily)
MFSNRRVVAATRADGTPAIVADGAPLRNVAWGDGSCQWIWSTDAGAVEPGNDPTIALHRFFPGPGGTRFMVETFPPGFDLDADPGLIEQVGGALSEAGIDATMESIDGGMHATATIDYGVVLSGSIFLTLDTGDEVELRQGDCYVQAGLPHAWTNRSAEPCTIAFVIVAT